MNYLLKKFLCGVLFTALLVTSVPTAFIMAKPEATWPEAPEITSESAIVLEASTGTVIYNKSGYDAYSPASTTKLMTALLAIEQAPLSDIVTCSYDSVNNIGWDSSRIGLEAGEQIDMENALYAILLASANEVSYAVAEHVGGSYRRFVNMMNERAKDLGCVNTNFNNPHGLDDPQHYSCAYDLALIARKAIEYTTFCRISQASYREIPPTNMNVSRVFGNTHQILRKKITCEGVFAGKTGSTSKAGNCLITCAERNGMTLICVILKAPDSNTVYNETISLINFAYDNFTLASLNTSDTNNKNAFPYLFSDEEALISDVSNPLAITDTTLVLPKDASYQNLVKDISLTPVDELTAGDNIIGEVNYYYAGNLVGVADIVYYSANDVIINAPPTEIPEEEKDTDGDGIPDFEDPDIYTPAVSEPVEQDYRPFIIGAIVAAIILVCGLYLVIVEIPYQKRKKEYYRNRRR